MNAYFVVTSPACKVNPSTNVYNWSLYWECSYFFQACVIICGIATGCYCCCCCCCCCNFCFGKYKPMPHDHDSKDYHHLHVNMKRISYKPIFCLAICSTFNLLSKCFIINNFSLFFILLKYLTNELTHVYNSR